MVSTSLTHLVETALPALSGSPVTYNAQKGIYVTNGYTSAAGNTYFQGIRLSDRIIINYDLGQGYSHLFLNGIRIYGYNGKDKHLIGSRSYDCTFYSERLAKEQAIRIVSDYMKGQMKLLNVHVEESQIRQFSLQLVDATASTTRRLGA